MDDHSYFDPSEDPQVQGLFKKLAYSTTPKGKDDQVAPLFPGFEFDVKLVAGITPIERHGPLDFYINRPNGMRGWIINLTVDGMGRVFDGANSFTVEPGDLLMFPPEARHFYGTRSGCCQMVAPLDLFPATRLLESLAGVGNPD